MAGKPNFLIEGQLGLNRYWGHGDIPGAKALMKNAISLNPGSWSNWAGMGFILLQEGKLPEAEACLRQSVINGGDKDYTTLMNLGKCLFSQGKYGEADPFLLAAQELSPGAEGPRRYLVDGLMRRGRYAEAEVLIGRALALNPRNLGSLAQRAACEAAMGRGGEAEEMLQRALQHGGDTPRAQLTLVYALLECPDTPKALLTQVETLADQASTRLGPEDKEALDYLAWAKERNGKPEEAARLRDRARSLGSNKPTAKGHADLF